jgi:hypothetical protein
MTTHRHAQISASLLLGSLSLCLFIILFCSIQEKLPSTILWSGLVSTFDKLLALPESLPTQSLPVSSPE